MLIAKRAEQQLVTHDIALPLDPNPQRNPPARQLRILLLSAVDVEDARLSATLSRIKHLASITSTCDRVVVFSLAPPCDTIFQSAKEVAAQEASDNTAGTLACAKLQAALLSDRDMPTVRVLLLSTLDGLSELLKKHVAAIVTSLSRQPTVPLATPFDLLRQCTANPPMPQQTLNFLSDVFPGIRELAAACTHVTSAPNSSSPSMRAGAGSSSSRSFRTQGDEYDVASEDTAYDKLKQLRDLVGDEQCRNIVDFWKA